MTAFVQVFGRRNVKTIDALGRPASEKRQGTKSRRVGHPAVPLAVLAALGLLDPNDLLRAVDMLDLQPDHLAGTQAAAIAETEENARLEAAGNGQQALRLVRAHHQRNLLWLTDVIDLGGKIQSPQRHAEQEPQPGHDAVAVADARAGL